MQRRGEGLLQVQDNERPPAVAYVDEEFCEGPL
jgi:hypothetical protein